MLNQILLNTPRWVWFLLVALVWLGLSQSRTRKVSLQRVTVMSLAMVGLSLYGTVTAFGADVPVMLVWLLACALMMALVLRRRLAAATCYDANVRCFTVAGSWVPLILMMAIFMTKYLVGALGAMNPALLHEARFMLGFAALYGIFSGIFLGRAIRLWRLLPFSKTLPLNAG
ncbi:hypothetical protein BH11PSE12_BH11PSE12_22450 [soil metagenome]